MTLHRVKAALVSLFLVVAFATQSLAADQPPGTLIIEISGLQQATGNVYVAVYSSASAWLGDEVVTTKKVVIADARDGDLVRTEVQLPPGEYALSAFHDKDDDGQLSTNMIGMPKEPIALSNNAQGKFGPPKYEDAVFTVGAEPTLQRITMHEM